MRLDPRIHQALIEAVDTRFRQLQRSQPRFAYGVVESVDEGNRKVAVYLSGDTTESPGFTYTGTAPEVDDLVRVVIDPRGDRWVDQVLGADGAAGVPTGSIVAYGTSIAPEGWLLCDGSAVSRTTYSELFAILGTTYGAGNGSSTFNLPDLRGRFPLGKAASGTGDTLGETGGDLDHVHSGPSHTHTGPSHTHSAPDHQHRLPIYIGSGNALHTSASPGTYGSESGAQTLRRVHTGSDENLGSNSASLTEEQGGTTGSGGTGSTGSGGTGDTGSENPPFLVVNYIIKT